jgi:hypothetical protein
MSPDNVPLTGKQLRTHAGTLARKAKIEGPASVHAIQLHSTVLLADYAANVRQLLALLLRIPAVRKWVHADPVLAGLYVSVWTTEKGMEIPEHLQLSQVPAHEREPVPRPPQDPQAAQA